MRSCQLSGFAVRGKDGTFTSFLLHVRKETLIELYLTKRITFDSVIYWKVWRNGSSSSLLPFGSAILQNTLQMKTGRPDPLLDTSLEVHSPVCTVSSKTLFEEQNNLTVYQQGNLFKKRRNIAAQRTVSILRQISEDEDLKRYTSNS